MSGWTEVAVYVDGAFPKSKKAVREAVADNPRRVHAETVSHFNVSFVGTVDRLPPGNYTFAGPDPWHKRNFFGQIIVGSEGRITIK